MSEFDRLHPRAKAGTEGGGRFIDVANRLKKLGGEYDASNDVWMTPPGALGEVTAMLRELDYDVVPVPDGYRPATDEDRKHHVIPPGWTDPMVALDATHPVQVRGRDAAGRVQTIRSKEATEQAKAEKFARVKAMRHSLPMVDAFIDAHAGDDDTAAALMCVRRLGMRPGSTKDTGAKTQAYGASTLLKEHVRVEGDTVFMTFTGKKGVPIELESTDPELAEVLRKRLVGKRPGDRVFDTSNTKMLKALRAVAPEFLVKDLRTAKSTSIALQVMDELGEPKDKTEAKKFRNIVGDRVSDILGNTRSVALNSYVDPGIFDRWEVNDGTT